jgi:plastocyanin
MLSTALLLLAASALPALAEVHKIDVGADGALEFKPEAIFANVGDQVTFTFRAKNHTVTQSAFADPCSQTPGGFDSGFQAVAPDATDLPSYTITVSDTKPIWVFCRQASKTPASHCGAGMVFAVNCGADGAPNSFTNFKNSALAQGQALKAAASSPADSGAPAPTDAAAGGGYGSGYGSGPATTDYQGGAYDSTTVPPAPNAPMATATVSVESSTWTTTYASYPNSPAPTPVSLNGTTHTVIVGGNGTLAFDPPNVVAAPRDVIQFIFQAKNHTITQSSFAAPCRKLESTSTTGQVGFDSGFMPVAAGVTDFPSFSITVNDTAPIWAYCRQTTPVSHCGMGMTFSVNADESGPRNTTAFNALAKQLNGTSSGQSGAASPSPTAGLGGAANAAVHARPAGMALFAVALAAILFL